ncbi:uncharacterized protein LOC135390043 isoform X2 [Ornithodoros turicata]|uniref:uncharacterized protein LOC135390043 isoform X2 n=1 Tax=Ornithodoros turicata TaxID=34597 RepID=UPI00313949E5
MSKFWEFEPYVEGGDEDFISYIERFGHFWKVTRIEDNALKTSALITEIGKRAYKTLKDLLLPSKPQQKTYDQLVQVLKDHYAPEGQVIAERFKFNRRYQHEGESVSTFAVELKHLAAKCDFGAFLDDSLRDRFVAGLKNPGIQAGLLKNRDLKFTSACDFAKSVELAEEESKVFQPAAAGASSNEAVNAVKKSSKKTATPHVCKGGCCYFLPIGTNGSIAREPM